MILLAAASLALCAPGPRDNCVVDGDTLWLAGEKIRIEGIDAPETDQAKCPAERAQGEAAKRRLQSLLNSGPIDIQRTGTDRYRRTLARVLVNGVDVGEVMVGEGLVRPYGAGRRPWC